MPIASGWEWLRVGNGRADCHSLELAWWSEPPERAVITRAVVSDHGARADHVTDRVARATRRRARPS
jgi:hypothetical protein